MVNRRAALALALTALAAVIALGPARAARAQHHPMTVVATTGMIADAARQIGGDRVHVRALMGPGVDPHSYRQTRSDIVAMAEADLVLWHGLYLEAQMEDFMLGLDSRTRVVAVGEATPEDLLISHDSYANRFDPHIWMDPQLWRYAVEATRDALIEADPDGAASYRANADAYLAELDRLATYARQVLGTIPLDGRVLVTAHDAFNYFGLAYGFEVVGLQGISTESEAGLQRVSQLVDLLVDRSVGAVFVESSVSDRNIRALIEGAAAEGHEVRIGGELFSDAMGEPGTYEGTYVGMIDHNVTVIAQALGGQVPDNGMTGRLSLGR